MEQVGVEAVVEGLQSFMGDMRQINSALDGLRPTATGLQGMFQNIGEAVVGFGQHLLRVAETTIGIILRDAIEFAITKVKELISSVIEAGSEFQILELRLERLNFNSLIESGMDANKATEEAIRLTKEQLDWVQKLAASSPYDAKDVANTYTLARSYGFTADEAKKLTENILEFASGMGLGREEMERIIINFGQLQQQGKLNGQELRDLARGAFVPINDILERMAKNMGISVEDLNKMRAAGEGGTEMVSQFFSAFNELVGERFTGASQKMSETAKGATDNFKDLFKSILGLNVVVPILDVIGKRVAGMISAFTGSDEQWKKLTDAAKKLGESLASIVSTILDLFLPDAATMGDSVVKGLTGIAEWITAHKQDIVDFFISIRDVIKNDIVPWIRDQLIPTLGRIFDWVGANKDTILGFFQALWEILAKVVTDLLGGTFNNSDILGGLLDAVQGFMEFIIQNKTMIAEVIEGLIRFLITWQIIVTVFNTLVQIILTVVGAVLSIISVFAILSGVAALLGTSVGVVIAVIAGIGAIIGVVTVTIVGLGYLLLSFWGQIVEGVKRLWGAFMENLSSIRNAGWAMIQALSTAVFGFNWFDIGFQIMMGIADGITNGTGMIVDAAWNAAQEAYDAAATFLGIQSPSKLFKGIGEMSMMGMAEGIKAYAGMAQGAMVDAVGKVAAPSMILPSMTMAYAGAAATGNSYNSEQNNNYNLNIHSNADREPIIQDFGLLKSLQGG